MIKDDDDDADVADVCCYCVIIFAVVFVFVFFVANELRRWPMIILGDDDDWRESTPRVCMCMYV